MESQKLLHDLPGVQSATGCGRSTIYKLFRSGQLHPVKIGRRTYVTDDELRRFVDALTGAHA